MGKRTLENTQEHIISFLEITSVIVTLSTQLKNYFIEDNFDYVACTQIVKVFLL